MSRNRCIQDRKGNRITINKEWNELLTKHNTRQHDPVADCICKQECFKGKQNIQQYRKINTGDTSWIRDISSLVVYPSR